MTTPFQLRRLAFGCAAGLLLCGCGEARDGHAQPAHDMRDMQESLVGMLHAQVAAYADHTQTSYQLVLDDGKEIALDFGADQPHAPIGQRVVVRGPRVGSRVAVDGYDIARREHDVGESQQATTERVKRNFRIAAIILDPKVPPAIFRSRIFGAFDSVATFFAENSYGDWTFEGDVFGPYAIPLDDCMDMSKLAEAAKEAASVDGLDASRYDKFLFRVPSDASCTWKFLSDFGVNEVRGLISGVNTWYTLTDCLTLANGVGVSFGLRRAHRCTAPPYVTGGYGPMSCEGAFDNDPFSPMGGSCGHFSAPESGALGFISGCNTLDVTSSGTFEIGPIEAKCSGPQVIRISANATVNFGPQYIYVEYRLGGQAVRSDLVSTRGVYFHASAEYGGNRTNIPDASFSRYYALDSIYIRDPIDTVGATWTEPSSGATFKLIAMGPTATVEVTLPDSTAGPAQCIDGTSPPSAPTCAPTLARFRDGGALADGSNGGNPGNDAGSRPEDDGAGDCGCRMMQGSASKQRPVIVFGLAALLISLCRRRRRDTSRCQSARRSSRSEVAAPLSAMAARIRCML